MEVLSKNLNALSSEESELLEIFEKLSDEIKQELLVFCKLITEEQDSKENTEKDK